MSVLRLAGIEVREIATISHLKPYAKGTKMAGKTFSTYRYDGKAFTVETSNAFNEDFMKGKVKTVKLIETMRDVVTKNSEGEETIIATPGLDFDTHITFEQWREIQLDRVSDAEVEQKILRLSILPAVEKVSEDMLDALTK